MSISSSEHHGDTPAASPRPEITEEISSSTFAPQHPTSKHRQSIPKQRQSTTKHPQEPKYKNVRDLCEDGRNTVKKMIKEHVPKPSFGVDETSLDAILEKGKRNHAYWISQRKRKRRALDNRLDNVFNLLEDLSRDQQEIYKIEALEHRSLQRAATMKQHKKGIHQTMVETYNTLVQEKKSRGTFVETKNVKNAAKIVNEWD